MINKAVLTLAAFGLASAIASTASAQSVGVFAVTGQVGTPGLGIGLEYWLTENIVLRGSFDSLQWDHDEIYDDVDYSGEVDFSSPGAFVDWHPTGGAWLISGGAYFGDRSVKLDATPSGTTNIGGVNYTPTQIGNITGQIALESTAPFVGLGFDNTFSGVGPWGFRAIAGAAFGDTPQVDLNASGGTLSNDPTFRARLADEEANIQEDADNFKVLPVVQLGVSYRF